MEYKKSELTHTELIENVISKESNKEDTEIEIDWNKLKSINEDIIGWIRIDGTHIDYPILKCADDLKYINRSFNGEYNKNGSIFTLNSNPFTDNVTILYGHNMKSGLMFSDLGKYMNSDFWYEHPNIEIYTKAQNYKAQIFSCYSIGEKTEENNIKSLSFEDEIEYYKSMSTYPIEDIYNVNKVIKLSTCSYLNNKTTPTNQRYYIIANLEIKN